MNKQELIERMAGKTGMAKKDCGIALDGMLSAITEALQKVDKIKLTGFGTFEVKHRAARTGRNPQTKETVEIPAQSVPVFKAGKVLKESILGSSEKRVLSKQDDSTAFPERNGFRQRDRRGGCTG